VESTKKKGQRQTINVICIPKVAGFPSTEDNRNRSLQACHGDVERIIIPYPIMMERGKTKE
jgi:hypothetical protein